jgi:hypothetical protein
VRLCGPENEDLWPDYVILKQDGVQLPTLWQTWSAEIHQVMQKRLRSYWGRENRPTWLKSLAANPASNERFLLRAETDLRPFFDAIRKDNRRLAGNRDCVSFCLQKAVQELAVAELSQPQPPLAPAPVNRWVVKFHVSFHRYTEMRPCAVQDELREKSDLLRGQGLFFKECEAGNERTVSLPASAMPALESQRESQLPYRRHFGDS